MNHVNYEICRRLGTPKKYTPPRLGNKGEITGHVATVRTLRIRSNSARLHASAWRETGWKPFSNGFFIFLFFFYSLSYTAVKSVDKHPSPPVTPRPTPNGQTQTKTFRHQRVGERCRFVRVNTFERPSEVNRHPVRFARTDQAHQSEYTDLRQMP